MHVDYALAGARAFRDSLAPSLQHEDGKKKPFRFVFCSGAMAEWDQTKPLYFMADTRRIKVRTSSLSFLLFSVGLWHFRCKPHDLVFVFGSLTLTLVRRRLGS